MYKKVLLASVIALSFASPAYGDEVTDNLKKRLLETQTTTLTTPLDPPRAYIGVVKDVIKDTLIIEDKDGKKDIKLSSDTTILRTPGNATIKAESIRIDDYIIAIGYLGEDSVLTGKRLIVSIDPIKSPQKTSGKGVISKITKSSITLKADDDEQVIDLTSKTILKSTSGTIELADLSIGDKIIYTATSSGKDDKAATVIMRIKTSSIE